jgi:hypothetical protein
MAGAVMYQQLNHQAAAMAYQDIYRLLRWMGMVACAFILSKTSLVMSSCRRSRALAIFLAMTVMPGQKFHPAAKCVTAAHDVASWGCRRQDFVRFVDANLLQKGLHVICNYNGVVYFTNR